VLHLLQGRRTAPTRSGACAAGAAGLHPRPPCPAHARRRGAHLLPQLVYPARGEEHSATKVSVEHGRSGIMCAPEVTRSLTLSLSLSLTHTHTHTHTHTQTHTHKSTHTYTHTHTRTYTHVCMPESRCGSIELSLYAGVRACVWCVYLCVCVPV